MLYCCHKPNRNHSMFFNSSFTNFSYFRWGTAAHIVFLTFCFMTNIIVTAMLLLGGSAVVNALTGVNIYAASFLIPLGVIVYTIAGGLKATFLASYIHSVIGIGFPNSIWSFFLSICYLTELFLFKIGSSPCGLSHLRVPSLHGQQRAWEPQRCIQTVDGGCRQVEDVPRAIFP